MSKALPTAEALLAALDNVEPSTRLKREKLFAQLFVRIDKMLSTGEATQKDILHNLAVAGLKLSPATFKHLYEEKKRQAAETAEAAVVPGNGGQFD